MLPPDHPEYVPTPKQKVPGAVHPLVAMKKLRAQGKAVGVGVVYDAEGKPKVDDPQWFAKLSPEYRAAVKEDLKRHGWNLTDGNELEKL